MTSTEITVQAESGIQRVEVPTTTARTPKAIMTLLQTLRPQLERAASRRMPVDTFMVHMGAVLMGKPGLVRCETPSIVECVFHLISWGLDPTGKNNGAHLVPYKTKQVVNGATRYVDICTIMFGYGALLDLAMRSGLVSSIDTQVVYDLDEFVPTLGTEPNINHTINLNSNRARDAGIAYYAVARYASGDRVFEVMTRQQVDDHRRLYVPKGSDAWRESFDEQGRKTAMRRLIKRIPLDAMATVAVQYMNDTEAMMLSRRPEVPELPQAEREAVREAQQRLAGSTKPGPVEQEPVEPERAADFDAEEDARLFIESLKESE